MKLPSYFFAWCIIWPPFFLRILADFTPRPVFLSWFDSISTVPPLCPGSVRRSPVWVRFAASYIHGLQIRERGCPLASRFLPADCPPVALFPHLLCPYYIGRAAPVKQGGPPVIKPLRAFIYFHFCGQPASPLFVRVPERGRGQNADSSGQNADSLGTKCRQ